MNIYFKELNEYLESKNVFGLTAGKRKHSIIYKFERYYNGSALKLRIKVLREDKKVLSVVWKNGVISSIDELKTIVEGKNKIHR